MKKIYLTGSSRHVYLFNEITGEIILPLDDSDDDCNYYQKVISTFTDEVKKPTRKDRISKLNL